MVVLAWIIMLAISCVTASPSQLRLSHSGYEIISLNENSDDDSKIAPNNSSEYKNDVFDFEKVSDELDGKDDLSMILQQHKHRYESQKTNLELKNNLGFNQNLVDQRSKESSDPTNLHAVFLTLGIPKKFTHPENQKKENSNLKTETNPKAKFDDECDVNRNFLYKEKCLATKINSTIKEKRYDADIRSKIKSIPFDFERELNVENEKNSDFFEPEGESVTNSNKIKFLVVDALHGIDSSHGKTDIEDRSENIKIFDSRQKFPIVGSSSIAIHNEGNFWVPPKNRAMFSPIYPSSLNILTENSKKKTIFPFNFPSALKNRKNQKVDAKNSKNKKVSAYLGESRNHDVHHRNRTHDAILSKKHCEKPKDIAPAFYQFLTKFSDIIIDSALQYEMNHHIRDSANRIIDSLNKQSSNNETSHFIS